LIIIGNSLEKLKELQSNSVQCIVTSPPYWGLRDYDNEEQLGQEKTPEEFVSNLADIFEEGKRVLKDDGTAWINIGDTYFGAKGGAWVGDNSITTEETGGEYRIKKKAPPKHVYLKTKDLIGVPWKFAIEMQKRGWYLRQDIIWHKPVPMPESVNDRLQKSHEHIFLFSKKKNYYFDAMAIAKPSIDGDRLVRLQDVWTIPTSNYQGAHFAVFPSKLPELCIKAGTKEGDIVLDPFMGSGTTAYVAQKLSRKWIGIELNPEYVKIIKERTAQQSLF
jgi:site-specific DNA-methyltransferase (cytosine-N4-specific)